MTKEFRLHGRLRLPGDMGAKEFAEFTEVMIKGRELQAEVPAIRGSTTKRNPARKKLLPVLAQLADGLHRLSELARTGDEEAIKELASHAEVATTLLGWIERFYPAQCRNAARHQVGWAVLARTDADWAQEAAKRIRALDLGSGAAFLCSRFRSTRGTDENYPARQWAKAVVRALEETRWRFLVYSSCQEGMQEVVRSKGWRIAPLPNWVEIGSKLPVFSQDSVGAWAKVIRTMIREEMPEFHLHDDWKNQRRSAEARGRNSTGEIQNAILDDITSALKRIAPVTPLPKSAC